MSRIDELVVELEAIVVELDELALDRLRDAVHEGATTRPDVEKRLVQARRAIEKAAHVLRGLAE